MLQLHVKTNQAYLITAGFLHKRSHERKKFAVVSVNRPQLQGGFVHLTPWPGDPWTPLGHSPRTPVRPTLHFQKYFCHCLWNKLCTPDTDNWVRALERFEGYHILHRLKILWTLVYRWVNIVLEFSPTLCKLCVLLGCQAFFTTLCQKVEVNTLLIATFSTLSQKTILTLHANYNVNAHQPIMVIFGRVVASVRFVEGVGGVEPPPTGWRWPPHWWLKISVWGVGFDPPPVLIQQDKHRALSLIHISEPTRPY